ncbi:cytochrome P450 [Mangrovimicrobium sediminis]|uniref:Cytochrome P450 n=1 Tax=Mangrovimicrobium sediminis TaxID=2562682 RepID=A0A4Z0LUL8_9GAMM|nr:cytochrome P450 [Haliea sp. SAOS-164]TGD70818.1 cytochrome P450 [Haliea sp. SAOS-164]
MTNTEPDFFSDPAVIDDPRGYFDLKRAQHPVAREPYHGTLMVTGYDAVQQVLLNSEGAFSSAASVVGPLPPLPFTPEGDDISAQLEAHRDAMPWSQHIVCFDGERHTHYRALMAGILNPQRIRQNEDYLYGLADRLLDELLQKDRCNIVPEYAHAATTYAIADLMGIPVPDRAELLALIGAPPSQLEGDAVHKVGPDPLVFLYPRFEHYLLARQAEPCADLMSEIANASLPDASAPDFATLVRLACFLFGAGQDTTSRLIAMGVKLLAQDPELQARLRREPERIADFVEETLRYDAPVKVAYRLALRKTSVAGIEIPAGTLLTVCLSAASNDPAHFSHPDKVDIDRPNVRDHIGFSKGRHTCIGAPLGRLEARIALERLLARTAHIELDPAHHGDAGARHFRYEPTYTFRSLADLYITYTPA